MSLPKLAVQLYTVRDQLAAEPHKTLEIIRNTGLEYVELAGTAGLSNEEFKIMLDDTGLQVCGMHVGIERFEKDLDQLVDEARSFECEWLVLPWIGNEMYKEGWSPVREKLQRIDRSVQDKGLQFAYHNHAFEFEKRDGKTGFESLFRVDPEEPKQTERKPNDLMAEVDVFWAAYGHADPSRLISAMPGRVPLVHLKDMGAGDKRENCDGGKGILDWGSILVACAEVQTQFGIIELDTSSDPIESVKASVEFFASMGLPFVASAE